VDPGILSIPGILGPSRDVPCEESWDHPGMSHVRGASGSVSPAMIPVSLVCVYLYWYMVTGHASGAHMIIICVYTVTLNCLYLLDTGHAPAIARFRELT